MPSLICLEKISYSFLIKWAIAFRVERSPLANLTNRFFSFSLFLILLFIMCLSSCHNCSFYTRPLHNGDVGCSINPYKAWLWFGLQGLEASLLPSLPVDDCRDFELKEDLKPIEINLTQKQIRELISRCSDGAILQQFEDYIDLDHFDWIDVDSSCLNAIAYNQFNSTLKIRFSSGDIYQYSNVPHESFESLVNYSSKGRYFNSYIKDIYDFQLVDE